MARRKEGAFFEIELSNGKYAYGRILPMATYAFYDLYSDMALSDINIIQKSNVIFICSVYNYAISKGIWKVIGLLELEQNFKILPLQFIQDRHNLEIVRLYDPNTGEMKPAKIIDCIGLECAAVWEPTHINDRLIDYFEGKPNKWVEVLKLKIASN